MSNRGGGSGSGAQNAAAGGSQSGGNQGNSSSSSQQQDHTSIVLEYLVKRGYHGAAQALRTEIDPSSSSKQGAAAAGGAPAVAGGRSISQEAFERRQLGNNANARAQGNAQNNKPIVREDPMPWRDGLFGLREFVHGSLDIHRPELLPILLPVYVHSIIDLILLAYKDQAELLFRSFAADYEATNPAIVNLLASLKTPAQVLESEQANRWRRERYVVRMTRKGWSLLQGWLQGGIQGLLGSSTQHGDHADRGREKMLGLINERVSIKVAEQQGTSAVWTNAAARNALLADGGGLESELHVDGNINTPAGPQSPALKLGPMPADPKLSKEVQRTLKSQGVALPEEASNAALDGTMQIEDSSADNRSGAEASTSASYAIPPVNAADLPPYPPSFRDVDVKREVEKVKEARKRIRLGPAAQQSTDGKAAAALVTSNVSQAKYNLPSVCMFTLHDTSDSLISTKFSEDSSLLAGGFSESYIRLWNLKGESLDGMSSDFDPQAMQTSEDLRKMHRSNSSPSQASTTRKLVGHSGPVYSMSFDPLPGPSGPPRYLLSSSQDATVRLWSLDTYSNIVAYRGHRDPVWDVEWGPRGVYFATASRDRTARLWTTERIAAVRIFSGHLSDVECVRFHPNSLYLATASSDRTCRLWDVQKGTCLRVFVGHSGPVSTVAISPDGRYLASAGDDANVNLWDLSSSRLIKSMTGHTGRVQSLSFSAESSVLVSGSADCTVKVWDVQTARSTAISTHGTGANNGQSGRDAGGRSGDQEGDLLVSLPTKRTPIFTTKFTPRNLCLAAGPIS